MIERFTASNSRHICHQSRRQTSVQQRLFIGCWDEWQPAAEQGGRAEYFVAQENLREWSVDRRGRDQFLLRYLDDTEVFWNDAQRTLPESVYKRENWTELFVQWSPLGSYVVTLHRQGVAIWGGASFKRLQRFSHPGVRPYALSCGSCKPLVGVSMSHA